MVLIDLSYWKQQVNQFPNSNLVTDYTVIKVHIKVDRIQDLRHANAITHSQKRKIQRNITHK